MTSLTKPKWSKPRKIDDRWIQMIGETVAICSNDKDSEKYIDFIRLTTYSNTGSKLYIDEDSPVDGGISHEYAVSVAEELFLAAAILKGGE